MSDFASNEVIDERPLLEIYELSEVQKQLVEVVKSMKNLPRVLSDEEIIWTVGVTTIGIPDDPSPSDLKFFERTVEARLHKLEEGERLYQWFSVEWTKPLMRRLILNWFCGLLVIVPDIKAEDGSPIHFVHEYYGEESGYPINEDQTDEWKKESAQLYVLMARSICRAYPKATTRGIVSFSDMKDFDWDKYDMESKNRMSDIGAVIPNKLARMITFNPDDNMRKYYEDMGARSRAKWGFYQYETFEEAIEGQGSFLPEELPTFVGGTRKVDILECMKYLFRREPSALQLLLETHSEMKESGELPCPEHML